MALEQTIDADDHWFVGETKDLVFTIYTDDTQVACLDVTGMALRYRLRKTDRSDVLIEKTTAALGGIVIAGVFNATPASNLQRVTVTISAAATAVLAPGAYRQRLARTDVGFETTFTFGDAELLPPS